MQLRRSHEPDLVKIDVLQLAEFLTGDECSRVTAEMAHNSAREAGIYGGSEAIDPRVRQALIASVSPETFTEISGRLDGVRPILAKHFNVDLSGHEPPQFLHYRSGDHFVAHQDGNTPLVRDDTLDRRISVSIFLNTQADPLMEGDYSGGSLVLHGTYPDWQYRQDVTSPRGTLVAFRSETTHEVLPVTAGERFVIVTWFRH